MSLPFDNPHLETGDVGGALSDWRVVGATRTNTDAGKVYVRDSSGTIEAAIDRSFAAVVASGPDVAEGATLVLSPVGSSGITITAARSSGVIGPSSPTPPANPLTVWFYLAGEEEVERQDNQLRSMLLRGEVDWRQPMEETMREFYLRMAAIYPPPPIVGYPNDLVPSVIENARTGSPEWYSQFFWSVSRDGHFEITGLQNPGDYRVWFVHQCLAKIYARKARIGDAADPIYSRQVAFQREADRLWSLTRPWVDVDRNQVPDRQPKVRSVRLTRG